MTNNTLPKETGHSELGGSGAPVWTHCTGSIALTRQAPAEVHTVDSDRGTLLHDWGEKRLRARLEHARNGALYKHPDDFYPDEISEADRDVCEGYVNYTYYVAFEGNITAKKTFLETKLILSEKYGMYGTPDVWSVHIDDKGLICVTVVDLKTGFKERDPKKDEQLGYYVLCIRKALAARGKKMDYAMAHFYQPMFEDDQHPPYKWTNKALDALEKKFFKVAEDVYEKKKIKFKVGTHCEKCRVKAMCTEYAKTLEEETNLPIVSKDFFEFPPVKTLSDEELARACVYGESVSSFIKDCAKHVLARHAASDPVEGIKVVRKRANRKIVSIDTTVRTLYELGFGDDDIYKKKLKGIGDLERLAGKEVVSSLVMKPEGQLTVASLDDEREEVLTPKELLELDKDNGKKQSKKSK